MEQDEKASEAIIMRSKTQLNQLKMLKGVKRNNQRELQEVINEVSGATLPTIIENTEGEVEHTHDNLIGLGQSTVMYTRDDLLQPDVVPPLNDLEKLADMNAEQLDHELKEKRPGFFDEPSS